MKPPLPSAKPAPRKEGPIGAKTIPRMTESHAQRMHQNTSQRKALDYNEIIRMRIKNKEMILSKRFNKYSMLVINKNLLRANLFMRVQADKQKVDTSHNSPRQGFVRGVTGRQSLVNIDLKHSISRVGEE